MSASARVQARVNFPQVGKKRHVFTWRLSTNSNPPINLPLRTVDIQGRDSLLHQTLLRARLLVRCDAYFLIVAHLMEGINDVGVDAGQFGVRVRGRGGRCYALV